MQHEKPKNIEPEIDPRDEDEEPALPEPVEDTDLAPSAEGTGVIAELARHAPSAPGVYRMIGRAGEVLYVGKAKNIKKRVLAYTRPDHDTRIERMIAATTALEFVSTKTETEA